MADLAKKECFVFSLVKRMNHGAFLISNIKTQVIFEQIPKTSVSSQYINNDSTVHRNIHLDLYIIT